MQVTSTGNAITATQWNATKNASTAAPSGAPAAATAATTALPAAPVETAAAVSQPSEMESATALKQALQDINRTMRALSRDLEFTVDPDNSQVIVKVVDKETQEIIRQMPSKEALEIAKALDKVQGLLIRQRA